MSQERLPNCLNDSQSLDDYLVFQLEWVKEAVIGVGPAAASQIIVADTDGEFYSIYGQLPDLTWEAVHDFEKGLAGFGLLEALAEFEARFQKRVYFRNEIYDENDERIIFTGAVVGSLMLWGILEGASALMESEDDSIIKNLGKVFRHESSVMRQFAELKFLCATVPEFVQVGMKARSITPEEGAAFLRDRVPPVGALIGSF